MVGVYQKEEIVILNALSSFIYLIYRLPGESYSKAACKILAPFLVCHLLPIRTQPHNVLDLSATNLPALKKISPPKDGMVFAQTDHALHESQQVRIQPLWIPVQPASGIVLTIRIIVT